jgi:thiamine-phosphate pyrophosphorylase
MALKLGLNGAYIPSFNKDFRHLSYLNKSSFLILGSAHNIKEIRTKEKQGVKLVFISSVFKKNNNYLGVYRFRILKNLTQKEVIALGGISKTNENKINLLKCYGFSGISYFE